MATAAESIAALNRAAEAYYSIIEETNSAIAQMRAEVTESIKSPHTHSGGLANGAGDTVIALATAGFTSFGACNIHIKTQYNVNDPYQMFYFKTRGYCYKSAEIIDATFVGCAHPIYRDVISRQVTGTHAPQIYVNAAGDVYLRQTFENSYALTITIDAMKCGYSKLPQRHEIEIIRSEAEIIE